MELIPTHHPARFLQLAHPKRGPEAFPLLAPHPTAEQSLRGIMYVVRMRISHLSNFLCTSFVSLRAFRHRLLGALVQISPPLSSSTPRTKSIWNDSDTDWVPSPKKKTTRTTVTTRSEGDVASGELGDPYASAIKLLQAITKYKSPREKLECVLKSLNQTVTCVSEFWRQYKKEVIVCVLP